MPFLLAVNPIPIIEECLTVILSYEILSLMYDFKLMKIKSYIFPEKKDKHIYKWKVANSSCLTSCGLFKL